jgi:PAS domain S-box-containing protein
MYNFFNFRRGSRVIALTGDGERKSVIGDLLPAAPSRDRDRTIFFAGALGGFVALCLAAGVALQLRLQHDEAIKDATRETSNLAQVLEHQTRNALQAVELTLTGIGDVLDLLPANLPHRDVEIHQLLALKAYYMRFVRSYWIVDADGWMTHISDTLPAPRLRLTDRDYFVAHRDGRGPALFIGQPTIGRVTGLPIIPVSIRRTTPDGSFAGVIAAGIDPAVFEDIFSRLDLQEDGMVELYRSDGTLLASQPPLPAAAMRSFAHTPLFRDHLPRAAAGTYRGPSPIDGMPCIAGFRTVGGFPLVVNVGFNERAVFKEWRSAAIVLVAIAVIVLAIAVALLVILTEQVRRREAAARAVVASEESRRRSDAERLHVLARYQTILERLPLACIATDRDFRITYWNPAAERIFGYSLAEVAGKHALDTIVPAEARPVVQERFDAVARGGVGVDGVNDNTTKDGRTIVCSWHNTPLTTPDGAFDGLIATAEDITQRTALEEQLRQSQKMEAVGQLTGGVAHDFNNLLQVVLGNAEMMLDDLAKDSPGYPAATMIKTAAERGAELTRHLLAFSRQQPLEPRSFDLAKRVAGMMSLLRRALGETIEVRIRAHGDPPIVVADPAQLENALLNLAVNARDAMPDGGTLVIETGTAVLDADYAARHSEVTPGTYGMVAVTDTGTGMPPEIVARVFEPFFTTKPVGKGTGLGLSMVYGFVKQSGGHVSVYSEVGLGTTIWIYLPLAAAAASGAPAARADDTVATGRETVLVVEDDDLVRAYAAAQLRSLGYTVIEAADGPSALARLAERPTVDLLFTDVVLPGGLNGRQLADKAKAMVPGLKVLYTSGYSEDALMHQGRLDPGVQLLSKPYRKAELARKIRQVLDSE